MRSQKREGIWRHVNPGIAAGAALVLFAIHPGALAQSGNADRWIGTWSTAEVGRPQIPPPPAPALPPFMASACPAPPAAAAPPVAPPPGQTFAPLPFIH